MRKARTLFLFLMLLVMLLGNTVTVSAADGGTDDPFAALTGDGKFLSDAYSSNYGLDTEKTGLLDAADAMANALASGLMQIIATLARYALKIFYFAVDFNLVESLDMQDGSVLDMLQLKLMNTIFGNLFLIGFCAVAFKVMTNLLRRNTTRMAMEIAKLILVVIVAALVVTKTSQLLGVVTGEAKSISLSVVMELSDEDAETKSVREYAADTSGVLWEDLVHNPWMALEFSGGAVPEDNGADILSKAPGSTERRGTVDAYISKNPQAMAKGSGWSRIAQLLVYFLPFLGKLLIYLACALIMLVQQLLAIFFALLAPLILLMSLFDSLGGFGIISYWFRKIMESQISMIVTMLLLGLFIRIGNLLTGLTQSSLGWLGSVMLQTGLIVAVFFLRHQIFGAIQRIRRQPSQAPQMLLGGSAVGTVKDAAQDVKIRSAEREQKQQQKLQAERDARQDEYLRDKIALVESQTHNTGLQGEKLEREKAWDEAHPTWNPHDKHYHYYTPQRPATTQRAAQETAGASQSAANAADGGKATTEVIQPPAVPRPVTIPVQRKATVREDVTQRADEPQGQSRPVQPQSAQSRETGSKATEPVPVIRDTAPPPDVIQRPTIAPRPIRTDPPQRQQREPWEGQDKQEPWVH